MGTRNQRLIAPHGFAQKNESRDNNASYSSTAAPTIIESKNGGVLLLGDQGAALRGVQVDAKKDVTVKGATVSVIDAVNEQSSSSTHYEKNLNLGTETWWRDLGTGINAKRTDTDAGQRASLAGTSFNPGWRTAATAGSGSAAKS